MLSLICAPNMILQAACVASITKPYRKAIRLGFTKPTARLLKKYVGGEGTVTLAPDVREYFPSSKAVNRALRTLISIVPHKRKAVAQKERSGKDSRRLETKSRAKKAR